MLAMSPFSPILEWEYEYPMELGTNQAFDNNDIDFDSLFFASNNISSSSDHLQALDNQEYDYGDDDVKQQQRSESPHGTINSSRDHQHQFDHNSNNDPGLVAKKLNHNASERDRRKKMNNMYSSLRALLPATDHRRKLSIPMTVGRAIKYIAELQKEVKGLTHEKEVLASKFSALQGNTGEFIQDGIKKPKNHGLTKETSTTSCSVTANKLGEKEMVIQISASESERISLAEVILLLEKNSLLVIDVSSFQAFGGTTFYSIHLRMEGNYYAINEALKSLLQTQKQIEVYS